MQVLPKHILDKAIERFISYARIWTSSDMYSETSPSTDRQLVLSRVLQNELESLGVEKIIENKGNLIAKIPASEKKLGAVPPVLLCAHIDTAAEYSGKNVSPQHIYEYDGKKITLQNDVTIDPKESPELQRYTNTHIITGDGRTLLGADDKAGLAGICTVVQVLQEQNRAHGPLELVFNTDEEIGKGLNDVPLDHIEARCGITADGQSLGSYECENFNAVTGTFHIQGRATHPGTAKNKMVNAIQLCNKLVSLFAENEFPESTNERDGYVCPVHISGSMTELTLMVLVRDFSKKGMERRLEKLERIAKAVTLACDGARVPFSHQWSYRNMYEIIQRYPVLVRTVDEAIQASGIEAHAHATRGGTDGALFADHGIALVNLFTGAHDLHGPKEWLAIAAFEKSIVSIRHFVSMWAKRHS